MLRFPVEFLSMGTPSLQKTKGPEEAGVLALHLSVTSPPSSTGRAGLSRIRGPSGTPETDQRQEHRPEPTARWSEPTGHVDVDGAAALSCCRLTPVHARVGVIHSIQGVAAFTSSFGIQARLVCVSGGVPHNGPPG